MWTKRAGCASPAARPWPIATLRRAVNPPVPKAAPPLRLVTRVVKATRAIAMANTATVTVSTAVTATRIVGLARIVALATTVVVIAVLAEIVAATVARVGIVVIALSVAIVVGNLLGPPDWR